MNETTKAEIRKRLSNITQLQDILLGDKIDEYNHKFEHYSERLDFIEAKLQKFRLDIEEQMTQLENDLLSRIDSTDRSLGKKITYLNSATKEAQMRLQQDLDNVSQNNHKNIDFIQNSLNTNTNSLKIEITQAKSALERDMQLLKQQVLKKLESNLTQLTTDKISRQDLAEVLFELSLELRGTKSSLKLPKGKLVQSLPEERDVDVN